MEEKRWSEVGQEKKRIYEAPMTPVNIWNDGTRENKGLEEGRQKERERCTEKS